MLLARTSIMILSGPQMGPLWNYYLVYLQSLAGALLLSEILSSRKEWKDLVAFASHYDIHQFDKLFMKYEPYFQCELLSWGLVNALSQLAFSGHCTGRADFELARQLHH